MLENQLNFDEIEDEYIDTMIRLAFKQEEALETQEIIAVSNCMLSSEEQASADRVHKRLIEVISDREKTQKREKQMLLPD